MPEIRWLMVGYFHHQPSPAHHSFCLVTYLQLQRLKPQYGLFMYIDPLSVHMLVFLNYQTDLYQTGGILQDPKNQHYSFSFRILLPHMVTGTTDFIAPVLKAIPGEEK